VGRFHEEWQAWRDAREQRMRDPHGWLAITAIHWLTADPQRFDDVPGEWSGAGDWATVGLAPDEAVSTDAGVLDGGVHRLGPLDVAGTTVVFGDATAQVARRDAQVIVRPRHPDSPTLRAYRGTPCYPADRAWVHGGRFEPYAAPDGAAVGEVVFTHDGDEHRLVAWGEAGDSVLWILFRDATSGVTTYAANRQLVLGAPAPDGMVQLDFNRAFNMPCAYTEFATCPVPPAANTLPFAVEAGERLPLLA
jgi:uncharacterized protein